MRNQPSNLGRGSKYNYTRPNTQPTEIRYITKQLSEENGSSSSSRTNRRSESTSRDTYEFVPQVTSSQKRYLKAEDSYEKPSLPYYVVPVLYVPQKVLSSQDIRQASTFQQKPQSNIITGSQKFGKQEEVSPIDVDKIPCIPCETKKKLQQKSSYTDDSVNTDDVQLNQGYINTSYCKSSTSVLEDSEYEEIPNYYENRYQPPHTQYGNRLYHCSTGRPIRKCDPEVYEQFLHQQKKFADVKNRFPSQPSSQMQWKQSCECYKIPRERFCSPAGSHKVIPKTSTIATTTSDLKSYRCKQNYERPIKICSDRHYCFEEETCDDSSPEDTDSKPSMDYQKCVPDYNRKDVKPSPIPYHNYLPAPPRDVTKPPIQSQAAYCPGYYNDRGSVLYGNKAPSILKKIEPYIGVGLDSQDYHVENHKPKVSSKPSRDKGGKRPSKKPPEYDIDESFEVLSASTIDKILDDTQVLSVSVSPSKSKIPSSRTPKESQTTFEDPMAYSTYIKNDDNLRDSKSTQTVDAKMTSVAAGTQTDRTMSMFATCPPPYIQQIRDEVNLAMKQKYRDISTSPARVRRTHYSTKQYVGDTMTTTKKYSLRSPTEVSQKSPSNGNSKPNKRRKFKTP